MNSPGGDKPKRSFKEKLLHSLSEAEAEAVARNQAVVKDKQQLLIEMLVEGHPQSFVDFFYLTHQDGVADDTPTREELEAKGIDPDTYVHGEEVPQESLSYLKENLVMADAAARRGDMKSVYNAYKNLAKYFESANNHKKAIYFYEKCHTIAKKSHDSEGELEANLNLGAAHENLADTGEAIKFHERHLELAKATGIESEIIAANQNLVQVYKRQAEELEGSGNIDGSIEFYRKMMSVAQSAHELASEGLANYRIGIAYQKLDDPKKALDFHSEYLRLCKECGDKVGEGSACCALAQSHQDLGDVTSAISFLEQFLELSKNGDPSNQARACCSLGVIYTRQKKYERAVTYFEKFFEVARSLNDRRMLDIARVNLGISRGSARTGRFMEVVSTDIHTLLQWKNVRMPIDSGAQM
mmetsp:Transcript_40527/g.49152  ORF Transcript_40527/g.49152 Transcript_40527/m.49152 type:complete len:413 (+) Transcript_40527:156-1394(+)|eukprot:CAMPEP_0197867756 /NCGR_PEP_ID=MMETSP1438-20131217/44921_1 /TAXON_ID=1461541 /ORGANISM="Pterosperma sp., Strain CCMP1384" /LENGTH=412 /DNA_ID=CAMNT_0043486417 /DNA_START=513 /DNA_END=1751 /DNA_ORIENTATION=-